MSDELEGGLKVPGEEVELRSTSTYVLRANINSFSATELSSVKSTLSNEIKRGKAVYVKANVPEGEDLTDELAIKLEAEYEKTEGKALVSRLSDISEEEDLRLKETEKLRESVKKSEVSFTGRDSIYNESRITNAIGNIEDIWSSVEDSENSLADLKKELSVAATPEEKAKAEDAIRTVEQELRELESERAALEKIASAERSVYDKHTAVVSSLSIVSEEDDAVITKAISTYEFALSNAKGGTAFVGTAADCRSITLGSLSEDGRILDAIRSAALEGKYSMTFEADLWSWNTKTLQMLANKGFLLDLNPTSDAYDKSGNKIGKQFKKDPSDNRRSLLIENADLIVSWNVVQESYAEKK